MCWGTPYMFSQIEVGSTPWGSTCQRSTPHWFLHNFYRIKPDVPLDDFVSEDLDLVGLKSLLNTVK